jgi:hypothetical protein
MYLSSSLFGNSHFVDEKNTKRKQTIRVKVNECVIFPPRAVWSVSLCRYLKRAEEIGEMIASGQDKQDAGGGGTARYSC